MKRLNSYSNKERGFIINLRSRHSSHDPIRRKLPRLKFRSIVRLGSTTELNDGYRRVECNSAQAIQNSANKHRMKECFAKGGVNTCDWTHSNSADKILTWAKDKYGVVAKHNYGSRNNGNTLITSEGELKSWMRSKNLSEYIFERFFEGVREYRLHVTQAGCFYTCRKLLKNETPKEKRWFRNDSNCNWIIETNEKFNKPANWGEIVKHSVMALKAVGLDIGACDVKVNKKGTEFKVIEINSAPSFGDITEQRYLIEIPRILKDKFNGGH